MNMHHDRSKKAMTQVSKFGIYSVTMRGRTGGGREKVGFEERQVPQLSLGSQLGFILFFSWS